MRMNEAPPPGGAGLYVDVAVMMMMTHLLPAHKQNVMDALAPSANVLIGWTCSAIRTEGNAKS